MTTTLPRTESTIGATTPDTTTTAADLLLALLDDALSVVAEVDPDHLHARTPAGRELVSLAAIARRAAAAMGAEPGTHLTEGRGVVVVRDLVAATRLLARTASGTRSSGDDGLRHLVAAGKGVQARLLDLLTNVP